MASPLRTVRFYSRDDPEVGITTSQLRRLGRERQWEYVRHWFRGMFEDPANETPRPEGEYLYVWGGPYDALEQIGDQFGDIIGQERLEDFASRIERNGVLDWAPGPNHPDHARAAEEYEADRGQEEAPDLDTIISRLRAGAVPVYGGPLEQAQRAAAAAQLDRIERLLANALRPRPGSPGRNEPPDGNFDEETEQQSRQVLMEATAVTAVIRNEFARLRPDALTVAEQTSKLRSLTVKLPGALASGALAAVAGKVTTYGLDRNPEIVEAIYGLVVLVGAWLGGALGL
jgi:hypothetical protein